MDNATTARRPAIEVIHADCVDVMARLAEQGRVVHAIVTDPPYNLTSIIDRFGGDDAVETPFGSDGAFQRISRGFMGKTWDTDIAFRKATWRLAWDLLPPGGHLGAFGGTRTWHRMAVAIEDAGFEIRDCLAWLYGSGWPKSHDVSKSIVKLLGPGPVAAQWEGWGTALKPAWEPIVLARKPIWSSVPRNVLRYLTGGLNIDASRVPLAPDDRLHQGVKGDGQPVERASREGEWGFRAVDRQPGLDRWPANVLHDGSDEVEEAFAAFGADKGARAPVRGDEPSATTKNAFGDRKRVSGAFHGDRGTASRFFYSAKAGENDRAGSEHPTVKPLALMQWLVRLMTPPGGTVLDPFSGSGSTLEAAFREGFDAIGIEADATYYGDIKRRLAERCGGEVALARPPAAPPAKVSAGPLFDL
ncbi:DNA-methyltransferase [Rhodovarius crocodyli]|nr:site-specific DNA-methyltransferase [Rhodovarius crocodyli]